MGEDMSELLVLQPDGTVREGTPEDWKEYARFQQEQAEVWREIADLERELRKRIIP